MFLSKRGSVYELFYFDEANRRHKVSTKCSTKSDALQFLQQFKQTEQEVKLKLPERHPAFLTLSDFHSFLKLVDSSVLRDLFITAVCTGMRLGELTAPTWEDVDFSRSIIHARNSAAFTTKSGKNRVLPMNADVCDVLLVQRNAASSGFVFHLRCRKLRKAYVSKGFNLCVRTARLDEQLHFHSRHPYATWLADAGVSLYAIQKLLGHSTISMTQMYAHLQPEQLHAAASHIRILTSQSVR